MTKQPDILISRPHALGAQGIRAAVSNVAADMAGKYHITYQWEGGNVAFAATSGIVKGLRGTIYTGPTQVQVAVFLPLMLQSFRKSIDTGIAEALDARLSAS